MAHEAPPHIHLQKGNISQLAGLFNWTMHYEDSTDVVFKYGDTQRRSDSNVIKIGSPGPTLWSHIV